MIILSDQGCKVFFYGFFSPPKKYINQHCTLCTILSFQCVVIVFSVFYKLCGGETVGYKVTLEDYNMVIHRQWNKLKLQQEKQTRSVLKELVRPLD